MTDTPEEPRLPPSLRLLKALVIVLMITMIVGVITVVWLLVTRMPDANANQITVPAQLHLPAGVQPEAVTMGKGWIGVVTTDNRMLIYAASGALLQEIVLSVPKSD